MTATQHIWHKHADKGKQILKDPWSTMIRCSHFIISQVRSWYVYLPYYIQDGKESSCVSSVTLGELLMRVHTNDMLPFSLHILTVSQPSTSFGAHEELKWINILGYSFLRAYFHSVSCSAAVSVWVSCWSSLSLPPKRSIGYNLVIVVMQ